MIDKLKSKTISFLDSDFFYYFNKNKNVKYNTILLLIIILAATFANFVAPFDPFDAQTFSLRDARIPPSWLEGGQLKFILGTDQQGRDLFSAMLYGLRVSLIIGFAATALELVAGTSLGLIAGYFGKRIDAIIMRIADLQLAIPSFITALIVAALFQKMFGIRLYSEYALYILIFILAFSGWPIYARLSRSVTLSEKEKEYVESAKVMGLGSFRILFKHIMPNTLYSLFIIAPLHVAGAIGAEAGLSYLGVGMPASHPSLGALMASGEQFLLSGFWWITIFPSIMLFIILYTVQKIGRWLGNYSNPKIYNE